MRAFTVCVAAVMLASAASAVCVSNTSNNLYASATTCSAYGMCGATLCSCVGSSTTNAATCLAQASNTTTCASLTACIAAYTMCIEKVPSAATGCNVLNASVRVSQLSAATAGYEGSRLQQSCRSRVCNLMNTSSLTCDFGPMDANVCMFHPLPTTVAPTNASTTGPNVTSGPASMAPGATNAAPEGFVAAIVALLVLTGDFALIQADPVAWAQLKTAVASDLAGVLGVDVRFLHIIRMWVASLHVEFAVSAAAGVDPAVLNTRINEAATNVSWLTATTAVYRTKSNGTIGIGSFAATSTAAPGLVTPVPPTPAPTSPSVEGASAGVMTAAAAVVAAVAAVFAL